jgi:sigma-B regulation protein RsbU (phosphoserine phosphatase)
MVLMDTQLTGSQVLRAFLHDEPFLFLGAAFVTVGAVSAAFCILRRRFDALLVWMAIFAGLYGLRLWLRADILRIVSPGNVFLARLRSATDFLIPIPAVYFFRAAGFIRRGAKVIIVTSSVVFLCMFAGTLAFGPKPLFEAIANFFIISTLWAMGLTSLFRRSVDRDFVVVRRGILCFVAFALWDNLVSADWLPKLEPYAFAFLLGCLGYVSARRLLERDLELGEIQKELDLARRIQLSILPADFPDSNHFRVAARYVPMTSVAGDLYDFLVAGESQAGLLIADVSGHGVPAALIASMVKIAATSQRAHSAQPAQLLSGMNTALCGNTQGQFVTAAYVHLDAGARQLRYAAAGHPAMLLLRGGSVTEISENGMLLAALDSATFTQATLPIEPGDRLLLYTDGITEARNTEGRLFGEEALSAAFRQTAGLAPGKAADGIIAQVQAWSLLQDDDLTLLICDYLGPVDAEVAGIN